jgi:hypothetical protein
MAETSKPSIEVELKEREMYAEIERHLKNIVEDMLRLGRRVLSDTKEYYVTVERNGGKYREKIVVSFSVEIKASDDLVERAWKEVAEDWQRTMFNRVMFN